MIRITPQAIWICVLALCILFNLVFSCILRENSNVTGTVFWDGSITAKCF